MGKLFKDDGQKRFDLGSHRIAAAEDTLERVLPLTKRFGVTRIANVTGLDKVGIPVTLAIRPNSKSVAVSQGKGSTLAHAKVSALMETIEIWHAENVINPVLYGSAEHLSSTRRIVDLDHLPKNPESQFTPRTPCLWVEGVELMTEEPVLVPYEMVHADYTRPIQPAHGYFPASTNGLASGNSDLEAATHAICEVVERDALSLWHLTPSDQQALKRINLKTINNHECNELLKLLEQADLECGLWDITSDAGLVCVLCYIREKGNMNGHIGLGSGCHPCAEVAIRRAITEAAQTRLNYISGARDDLAYEEFETHGLKDKNLAVEEAFATSSPLRDANAMHSRKCETLADDLTYILDALNALGIKEVVWVNLSRPEYNIPVARVIIPGLETPHDDANYVPGTRARKVLQG